LDSLEDIVERIRAGFEAKNAARDRALSCSRELIRHCSRAIRAVHRGEIEQAQALLETAREVAAEMAGVASAYPDLYFAGYTQDALKELAEAHITHALITDSPLPTPEELKVEPAAYLNGMAEAVGELRRHVLDGLRRGEVRRGEELLQDMEDIYSVLVTMDFADAITGGLRRNTDMVRGVLERTRGDLTVAVRQQELEDALRLFEERVTGIGG
jgi:translin